jgi:DNA-binding MarR family transcriptional regulator
MAENPVERVGYLMRVTAQTLSQRLERTLRRFGLTNAQLTALALLELDEEAGDGTSGAQLSQRAGVTAASMSSALAGLEERGLVVRSPHPTHGRVIVVRITPEGIVVLRRAQAAIARVEDRAFAGVPAEDRIALRRVVTRMMDNLGLPLPEPTSVQGAARGAGQDAADGDGDGPAVPQTQDFASWRGAG